MKILVVVDMQKDFIDGSLGSAEAQAIVENVVQKIKGWDGRIVCTMDTHEDNYLTTQEGKNLPVPHCVYATDGWELDKRVSDAVGENLQAYKVYKDTFGAKDMIGLLRGMQEDEAIDSITLVGLCTDICVISNAMLIKAFFPEIPIIVDASCCAGVSLESHRNALSAMKVCQVSIENE